MIIRRDHKENNGWTVKEIALKLDISERTVQDWCKENNISAQLIATSSTGQKGYILYEEDIKELAISVGKVFKEEKKEVLREYKPITAEAIIELGNKFSMIGHKMLEYENNQQELIDEVAKHTAYLEENRQTNAYEDEVIKDIRKTIVQHLMAKDGFEYNNSEYKQQQNMSFGYLAKIQKERTGLGKFTRVTITEHRILLKFYRDLQDELGVQI